MAQRKTLLLSCLLIILIAAQQVQAQDFYLEEVLLEGESAKYEVGSHTYDIELVAVFDSAQKAQFRVDEELTKVMKEDEMYRLSDGSSIQIRDVMPQEAGDGRDLVQYNFFPASRPAPDPGNHTESPLQEQEAPADTPDRDGQKETVTEENTEAVPPLKEESPHEPSVDKTGAEHETGWWDRFVRWLNSIFN